MVEGVVIVKKNIFVVPGLDYNSWIEQIKGFCLEEGFDYIEYWGAGDVPLSSNNSITLYFCETADPKIFDYVILPSFEETIIGCKRLYRFNDFAGRVLASRKSSFAINAYYSGATLLSPYSGLTVIECLKCKITFRDVDGYLLSHPQHLSDVYFHALDNHLLLNLTSKEVALYIDGFVDISGRAKELFYIDSLAFPTGEWSCDLIFEVDNLLTTIDLGVRWGNISTSQEAIAEISGNGEYKVAMKCSPQGLEPLKLSVYTCHPLFSGALKVKSVRLAGRRLDM